MKPQYDEAIKNLDLNIIRIAQEGGIDKENIQRDVAGSCVHCCHRNYKANDSNK